MRYTKIIFLTILSWNLVVKAQEPLDQVLTNAKVFGKESTELVINTNLLLTGDHLKYKIFALSESGKLSVLSKVAYVSLRNSRDSVIFKQKLKLENGMAPGSFFIPTTWETGVYQLLSHTRYSLNNVDQAIARKDIYIINPYESAVNDFPDEIVASAVKISPSAPEFFSSDSATTFDIFKLTTDKSFYRMRERIELYLENKLAEGGFGNYILSVRKIDPVQISVSKQPSMNYEVKGQNLFYLPELRGELISGRVMTVDGEKPAVDKVVAFSIPGSDYIFKIAKTNGNGRFFISVDEPYQTKNCLIQVVGTDRELYTCVLDKPEFDARIKGGAITLKLEPGIKEWLQERSIQLQIQNAYFDKQKVVVTANTPAESFYGSVGQEFLLDDYNRFPSLKETFVEVIRLARIRKKDGEEVFEVFDPQNPYKIGPFSELDPLLLMDGILIQSASDILNVSAHKIESIRVFPAPYRLGPAIFRGIIDIKTKEGDFQLQQADEYIKHFNLGSPLIFRQYPSPDYESATLDRIPDYRVQLLWDPNVTLTTKEYGVHFFASDVPGTFQIVLEGYTIDGKYISVKQNFKVE